MGQTLHAAPQPGIPAVGETSRGPESFHRRTHGAHGSIPLTSPRAVSIQKAQFFLVEGSRLELQLWAGEQDGAQLCPHHAPPNACSRHSHSKTGTTSMDHRATQGRWGGQKSPRGRSLRDQLVRPGALGPARRRLAKLKFKALGTFQETTEKQF